MKKENIIIIILVSCLCISIMYNFININSKNEEENFEFIVFEGYNNEKDNPAIILFSNGNKGFTTNLKISSDGYFAYLSDVKTIRILLNNIEPIDWVNVTKNSNRFLDIEVSGE